MSRARHHAKHRAEGGEAGAPGQYGKAPEHLWNAHGSNTVREAEQRKRGGKVEHHKKEHHEVEGHAGKKRHDRPGRGRKRGGGVGANLTPLSTAANVHHTTKGEQEEHGDRSD
jgi:hypothetical protein